MYQQQEVFLNKKTKETYRVIPLVCGVHFLYYHLVYMQQEVLKEKRNMPSYYHCQIWYIELFLSSVKSAVSLLQRMRVVHIIMCYICNTKNKWTNNGKYLRIIHLYTKQSNLLRWSLTWFWGGGILCAIRCTNAIPQNFWNTCTLINLERSFACKSVYHIISLRAWPDFKTLLKFTI